MRNATARRVVALFKGIGPGSAFHRSIMPEEWHWANEHELLATIAELIDTSNRLYLSAHSNGKPPKPIDIQRPGRYGKKRTTKGTTLGELQAMLKG